MQSTLELSTPETVQVAVGIDGTGLNAASEERSRGLTGLQVMNLKTTLGIERDPLNEVLLSHRMLNLADLHMNDVTIALELHNRHMLLDGSINRVRLNNLISLRSLDVTSGNKELARLGILEKRSHK